MLGPYIKSRGTRGTKMPSNAALITMETYVQQGGNNLKTSFSYMSQNVKKNKATRSPEISREQVQKLTPQFLLYIYIGYRFPLSLIYYLGKPPSS